MTSQSFLGGGGGGYHNSSLKKDAAGGEIVHLPSKWDLSRSPRTSIIPRQTYGPESLLPFLFSRPWLNHLE